MAEIIQVRELLFSRLAFLSLFDVRINGAYITNDDTGSKKNTVTYLCDKR